MCKPVPNKGNNLLDSSTGQVDYEPNGGAPCDPIEWEELGSSKRSIDRLAASLFVNRHKLGGQLVAVFTAYIDATGNSVDQHYVIVSGYIANWIQWRLFEDQWKVIHSEFGAELPFHMSELMSALTNPKYASQSGARKDYISIAERKEGNEFLKKLSIAQVGMMNCGVSCIVNMDIYNGVSSLLDLKKVVPPYAVGARGCLNRIRKWEREFDIGEPVECIFEEGDFGQGKFTDLMVSEGSGVPTYKNKKDFMGLQAADHYAWEQAFFLKKSRRDGTPPPPRLELVLQLNVIPKMHVQVTTGTLIELCHAKGINPATGVKNG